LPALANGTRQSPTTAVSRDPTRGSYDLHEVYAELNAPLLADIPAIYSLEVDAAVRYSKYSTVGGKATTKGWLPASAVTKGGKLSYTLSTTPSRTWGSGPGDVPPQN
jgi:putative alpha-1,2-mannosidase